MIFNFTDKVMDFVGIGPTHIHDGFAIFWLIINFIKSFVIFFVFKYIIFIIDSLVDDLVVEVLNPFLFASLHHDGYEFTLAVLGKFEFDSSELNHRH